MKLAKELKPDIVITDIRMPVMDGLELAKCISSLTPAVKLIILTGYGEFEYAQKAIEYKVSEFILKPVGAEELVRVVLKLKEEVITESKKAEARKSYEIFLNENFSVLQEKLINKLINGLYSVKEKDKILKRIRTLNMDLSGPYYQVFIIAIDGYFHGVGNQPPERREMIFESILTIAREAILKCTNGFIYRNEIGMFVSLVNVENSSYDIISMCKQIQHRISNNLNLSISFGVGNTSADIFNIFKSYNEAFNAVRNRIYMGKNVVIHINDVAEENSFAGIMGLKSCSEEEKKLLACLKLIDFEKMNDILDQLFERLIFMKADYNVIKNISLFLLFTAFKGLKEMGVSIEDRLEVQFDPFLEIENYETVQDIKKWMKSVLEKLMCIVESEKNKKYKLIVKNGIKYMMRYYNQPLSLTIVAKEVYVTPNYFSRVFREETGENFIEWLNKYRVEKAKEFLTDISMKTYEVAEKVGFNDYKHFSYNFKKYVGYSPTEYKDQSI